MWAVSEYLRMGRFPICNASIKGAVVNIYLRMLQMWEGSEYIRMPQTSSSSEHIRMLQTQL